MQHSVGVYVENCGLNNFGSVRANMSAKVYQNIKMHDFTLTESNIIS